MGTCYRSIVLVKVKEHMDLSVVVPLKPGCFVMFTITNVCTLLLAEITLYGNVLWCIELTVGNTLYVIG